MTPVEPEVLSGPIRSVGVVARERSPEITAIIDRLSAWLRGRDVEVAVEEAVEEAPVRETSLRPLAAELDLLIALGGDGTLLRAARAVAGTDTPVLGVNLGRLGFLTAFPDSDLEQGLAAVLAGEALIDHRFTLRAQVEKKGVVREDNLFALNDIVIHTSGAARVTPLALDVGFGSVREEVGSFSADGVILATPTGSTAYSMSAGGPIVVPSVECILVTPICPHSLAVRPMVLPASYELRVSSSDPGADHQVTVDGQVERELDADETVVVARAEMPVRLVRLPGQTFFATLRRKLSWAARPPERT